VMADDLAQLNLGLVTKIRMLLPSRRLSCS